MSAPSAPPSTETQALAKIRSLKHAPSGAVSARSTFDGRQLELLLLSADRADDTALFELLGRWRQENEQWFPATFKVTTEGTKRWYASRLIDTPHRLLFLVQIAGHAVGHVGLDKLDFTRRCYDLDNILRGEREHPGVMVAAIECMQDWAREQLGLIRFGLETTLDNERAIRLYERLGYAIVARDALVKTVSEGRVDYLPAGPDFSGTPDRWRVRMELTPEVAASRARTR